MRLGDEVGTSKWGKGGGEEYRQAWRVCVWVGEVRAGRRGVWVPLDMEGCIQYV